MDLKLTAPIDTWDEALPLGNGLMGALLWGGDGTIRISLDRVDLWDERPAPGNPLAPPTPSAPADGWLEGVPTAPKDPGVPMYP